MNEDTSELADKYLEETARARLSALADLCARVVVRGGSYADFAAEFARDELFAGMMSAHLDDPESREHRRVANTVTRRVWRSMPHPAARYAPMPLKKVERNDPCHCGSGEKYKKCCADLDRDVPPLADSLLPWLLAALPRERWPELARSAIDIRDVAQVAAIWLDEDRPDDVRALLEPWFVPDSAFRKRHALLFDILSTATMALEDTADARARFLERATRLGDDVIQSCVLRQRCVGAIEAGDFAGAWTYFAQARAKDPEALALIQLEIGLLRSEGRDADARERALDWIDALDQDRDAGLESILVWLEDQVDDIDSSDAGNGAADATGAADAAAAPPGTEPRTLERDA